MEINTIKHWKEVEETRQRGDRANNKMVGLNPTILITAQSINRLYNQNADCQIGFLKKQESNKCCLQKRKPTANIKS